LTALEPVFDPRPGTFWRCRCDCGKDHVARTMALRNGSSWCCGCRAKRREHGLSATAAYHRWSQAKNRCLNPNDPSWKNYGGRGITMCARWIDAYENFLADMGEPPPGMSLDRIDNDGNYEPSNCRWATKTEQCHNSRSARVWRIGDMTFYTKRAAAEHFGVSEGTIHYWCKSGRPNCSKEHVR
jgi:hypothetical protein